MALNSRAFRFALAAAFLVAGWAASSNADVLELRTGEIIQGKFLGGSPLNIRFRVNGQEQTFATKDVLNIGFSDAQDAANNDAAPPPPPSANNSDVPNREGDRDRDAAQDRDSAQDRDVDRNQPPPSPDAVPANASTNDSGYQQRSPDVPILLPAGTTVTVRMIDSVDSSTNRIGDTFHASLENALVVGNTVIAPKGADAYGTLTRAKEAGKISGAPELTLELTGIRINGAVVSLDSTDYSVAGKGRGKQSAERIGGAAVVGAILGGILGGGKGAAIGATLGAGGGTAVQVLTHGERVRVPSETLLEFRLEQDVPAAGPPAN